MDNQVAKDLMSKIAQDPMARPLFQRNAVLGFSTNPDYWLLLRLTEAGEMGAQVHRANDPALNDAHVKLAFAPEDLAAVAAGNKPSGAPQVTGSDQTLQAQLFMLLGIEGGAGGGGGSYLLSRQMIYDAQLSPKRDEFSIFTQHDDTASIGWEWRVETGVRSDGTHFAISTGLTDPKCEIPPPQERST